MDVKINDNFEPRKVLTTRNDGLIGVYIENGNDLSVFAISS